MMIKSTQFLLVAVLFLCVVHGQDPCTPPDGKPSCVCSTSSGTIDLTSLSSYDGTAQFQDIQGDGTTDQYYSYNPCTGFTEGDSSQSCSGYLHPSYTVAACQTINYQSYYSLGDPDTETMYMDGDSTYLQYVNGEDNRITKVYLFCDQNAEAPTLTANGDAAEQLTYVFHLKSKCACPGGCSDDPAPPNTDPTDPTSPTDKPGDDTAGGVAPGIIGIVLINVSFIGVIAYFVTGAIVLNRKYGKTGPEMIPNKNFWVALPFLVKDGVVFTFGPIVKLIKRKMGKGGDSEYEPLK